MKVKVRLSFILYLIVIGLIDGLSASISLVIALLVHEMAHIAVGLMLHEALDRIELSPFGGIITYKEGRSSSKGVKGAIIAAAGPAANYAALVFASGPVLHLLPDDLKKSLLMTNASMLLVNLLPVLPLDGGRIAFSVGYYLFPVTGLIAALTALGTLTGLSFILLAVGGALYIGKLNVSMLAVGAYMMLLSRKHGNALLCGSFYTVLQERQSERGPIEATRLFAVEDDTPLLSAFPMLCRVKRSVYLVERDEGACLISQQRLISALLLTPDATFYEAFFMHDHTKRERNQTKSTLYP